MLMKVKPKPWWMELKPSSGAECRLGSCPEAVSARWVGVSTVSILNIICQEHPIYDIADAIPGKNPLI